MTEERTVEVAKRIFLVVVDETEELHLALRFASRRAQHTGGRVALLQVMEPSDFSHWMAVEEVMEEEQRSEAEKRLRMLSSEVMEWSGEMPILYIRSGDRRDELFKLLEEEPSISVLVLGSATKGGGPGPLVSALTGKFHDRLHIPLTIVPGSLTEEEVDALT